MFDPGLDEELRRALLATGTARLEELAGRLRGWSRAQKLDLLQRLRAHRRPAATLRRIEPQPRGPMPPVDVSGLDDRQVAAQLEEILEQAQASKLRAVRA